METESTYSNGWEKRPYLDRRAVKGRMADLEVWTQADLAQRTKMTAVRLSQLLRGYRPPNAHELRRLSIVLDLPEEELCCAAGQRPGREKHEKRLKEGKPNPTTGKQGEETTRPASEEKSQWK